MRVAIFTDNDLDKTNGVTTTLSAVLKHAPEDLQPRIYTMSDLNVDTSEYLALVSPGVPVPYYDEMRIFIPRLGGFRRHLVADGIRLIHITTPGPMGLAGRYLAATARLPVIGSFHTPLADYATALSGSRHLGQLLDLYMRWLYGCCEHLLVPSRDTCRSLGDRGWRRDRMSVWPRGVDAEAFSPARRSAALRDRWHVGDKRPAIMYAGRLAREKGLGLLPLVGSLLYRRGVPYRLIVAGEGPMAPELRMACPDALFLGRLPHSEVGAAMASADLLLFPSDTDTAGNVVLEAQASGLPVLVSQLGGPREQILHGRTGFACRPGDTLDFGTRAMELLTSCERRLEMGAAARAHALTRSWREALQPLFAAYRLATASPAQGSAGSRRPALVAQS